MTTSRTSQARASAVSRVLSQAGMRAQSSGAGRGREGIRVHASILGTVTVMIDLDDPLQARYLADAVFSELEANLYTVSRVSETHANVSRPTWVLS